MTCVVGVEHEGHVWLGGDSAAGVWEKQSVSEYREPKVWRRGEMVWGFCGSPRLGQILRLGLVTPKHKRGVSDEEYVALELTAEIRRQLERHNYVQSEASEMDVGDEVLVGYHGQLWTVSTDYQAIRARCGFTAIGSGEGFALGALYALRRKSPRFRISQALRAASRFSTMVRPPYTLATTLDTATSKASNATLG